MRFTKHYIISISLFLLGILSLSAQIGLNPADFKDQVPAYVPGLYDHIKPPVSTEANVSFTLNYDSVVSNTSRFFWRMNSRFNQQLDLNYAIATFDTLVQTNGTSYDLETHTITIDSFGVFIGHQNASQQEDTVVFSIIELGPTGLPSGATIWTDSIFSDTSLTPAVNSFQLALLRPGIKVCEGGFGIRVDFFGPTTDTLGMLGGFSDNCNGNCGAIRSDLYANSYYYLHVPTINYAAETPDSLGFGIFFDCNSNMQTELGPGFCEDFPLQEWWIFPFITINDRPATTAAVTDDNCTSGVGAINATSSGGVAPYTYAWNTGATTEDLTGLNAGTYSLTITDADGCSNTQAYTISSVNVPPAVSFTNTPAGCGLSDGSITAAPSSGTAPYTYSWGTTPAQTAATATGLAAGTYSVRISDANGCFLDTSLVLSNLNAPSISQAVPTDVTCNGSGDGSINVTATGGTGTLTYNWSNGSTGSNLTGLGPGTYVVTVTDASGCVTQGTYTINEPAPLAIGGIVPTDTRCFGDSSGLVEVVNPAGGTPPYAYQWSNGVTTTVPTQNVPAGVYAAIVRDANGCTFTTSQVVVNQPQPVVYNISTIDDDGTGIGTITVVINGGGSGPFTFNWSTGATNSGVTSFITGLSQGTYVFTITDSDNCTTTDSVIINGPVSISPQEAGLSEVFMFPNPATNAVTLRIAMPEFMQVNLQLLDTHGRTLVTRQLEGNRSIETTLDVGSLSAGVYVMQIQTSQGQIHRRLVIE
ncbi:MAG: T9SS type A sorting domain-containing protein [Bacteroidota bacterium]